MLGNHQGEESWGELLRRDEEMGARSTFCVCGTGLNLGHARRHFTTALESQHFFLFTFYFKTKLPRLALNSLCIYPRQVLALSSSPQTLEKQ